MSIQKISADKKKKKAAIAIVASFILLIFSPTLFSWLIQFIETYLSPDHQLDPGSIFFLKLIFFTSILCLFVAGVILFLDIKINIRNRLNSLVDTRRVADFFLLDDVANSKKIPMYSLIIGTASGVLLHLYFLLYGEPPHEGIMEESSSFLFLFSGIIFLSAVIRVKRSQVAFEHPKRLSFTLTVLAIILLFIFGEEVSWGQRVFGWESFNVFEKYNFQQETNTHNFFNPIFKFVYPAVGMGSFVILCFLWFFPNYNKRSLINLFMPHPSLFFLFFIMACSSFRGHSEIYEELMGIFFVLYSFRILCSLNFPKAGFAPKKSALRRQHEFDFH